MSLKSTVIAFLYRVFGKPLFFLLDPEYIHDVMMNVGGFLSKFKSTKILTRAMFDYKSPELSQKLFNREYINPVGLSAGFDYEGKLPNILDAVGFGFQSVGTVTYSSYEGNVKPRLGRIPKSRGLLVNKGFKSTGVVNVLDSIKSWDSKYNVGISLGATNSSACSTAEAQVTDILNNLKYLLGYKSYSNFAFIEINISCPNVLGSGNLANPKDLDNLLREVRNFNIAKPLFIKFQLEIDWKEAKELIHIMIKYNVNAIILSNLLKHRENGDIRKEDLENISDLKGNISGKPTWGLSNELISKTYKEFGDQIKIIGVGGIFNAEDAYEKIKRGASLVQLITGMIFEGPQVIGQINQGLVKLLEKDGYGSIGEAVGVYHRK